TVSESRLLRVPGLQPLRKELLGSALKYYQAFLTQRGKDPALQRELASAYTRMARITAEVGSRADAMALYGKALAILDRLPRTRQLELDLSAHHQAVGNLHARLGDLAPARKSCTEAYTLLLAVSPQNPNNRTTVSGVTGTTTSGIRVHYSDDDDIMTRF